MTLKNLFKEYPNLYKPKYYFHSDEDMDNIIVICDKSKESIYSTFGILGYIVKDKKNRGAYKIAGEEKSFTDIHNLIKALEEYKENYLYPIELHSTYGIHRNNFWYVQLSYLLYKNGFKENNYGWIHPHLDNGQYFRIYKGYRSDYDVTDENTVTVNKYSEDSSWAEIKIDKTDALKSFNAIVTYFYNQKIISDVIYFAMENFTIEMADVTNKKYKGLTGITEENQNQNILNELIEKRKILDELIEKQTKLI